MKAVTSVREHQRHRLDAFGLNVECDWPLPGSKPAPAIGERSRLGTSIRVLTPGQIDAAWRQAAERIFVREYPDRKICFTVDRNTDHYRLWFEGCGRYIVAGDGTTIGCEREGISPDLQDRFLFAQVLPLAAVLQGFELIHASAICGQQGVAAITGASGAGKTSLASRLVLRGAGFVTDDVLALEARHDAPIVHPGPAFMAVPNQDRSLIETGAGRLGCNVGNSDKVHASPRAFGEGLPLRVLYYLEAAPRFEIAALAGADVHRILSSGFAPYLMTPDRLRRHLEISQLVSSVVAQFQLRTPPTGHSEIVLEAVEAHLRELGI